MALRQLSESPGNERGYRNRAIVIAALLAAILILSSCSNVPNPSIPPRAELSSTPRFGPKHVKARVESENASRGNTFSWPSQNLSSASAHHARTRRPLETIQMKRYLTLGALLALGFRFRKRIRLAKGISCLRSAGFGLFLRTWPLICTQN
jgi:hypothetical protein